MSNEYTLRGFTPSTFTALTGDNAPELMVRLANSKIAFLIDDVAQYSSSVQTH